MATVVMASGLDCSGLVMEGFTSAVSMPWDSLVCEAFCNDARWAFIAVNTCKELANVLIRLVLYLALQSLGREPCERAGWHDWLSHWFLCPILQPAVQAQI